MVSIVVPVYNVEKYLHDCLRSLIEQTYTDIEIIVVDDCSPDNSMRIAEEYAMKDSRIKLLYHEKNKKLGAARNTGIQAAKGEFIMFLDSDDIYPKDAISKLVNAIENTANNMVIGRLSWLKNGKITPVDYIESLISKYELLPSSNLRNISANIWYLGSVVNRIYRLDWLKSKNIFFQEGVYWEDVVYSALAWYHAEYIAIIPDIVYLRTERDDSENLSITQEYGMKKYLDRDRLEHDMFYALKEECGKNNQTKKDLEILLNRIFATTKNIIELRNEDIAQWTVDWFKDHQKRHDNYLSRIRLL